MKIVVTALALVSFGLMGCEPSKDADGNKYPTTKIGQQIWMAKNMYVKVEGSLCYSEDPANCEKYGRLYTWEAAMNVCPSGWHLPSKEEMGLLKEAVMVRVNQIAAQKKLNAGSLEKAEEKWYNHLRDASWKGGLDLFGFAALPAGYYGINPKDFYHLGSIARFWSSTEAFNSAYYMGISSGGAGFTVGQKDLALSVRCLRD